MSEYIRRQVMKGKVIADIYEMKFAVLKMAGDFSTVKATENAGTPKGDPYRLL